MAREGRGTLPRSKITDHFVIQGIGEGFRTYHHMQSKAISRTSLKKTSLFVKTHRTGHRERFRNKKNKQNFGLVFFFVDFFSVKHFSYLLRMMMMMVLEMTVMQARMGMMMPRRG